MTVSKYQDSVESVFDIGIPWSNKSVLLLCNNDLIGMFNRKLPPGLRRSFKIYNSSRLSTPAQLPRRAKHPVKNNKTFCLLWKSHQQRAASSVTSPVTAVWTRTGEQKRVLYFYIFFSKQKKKKEKIREKQLNSSLARVVLVLLSLVIWAKWVEGSVAVLYGNIWCYNSNSNKVQHRPWSCTHGQHGRVGARTCV